MKTKEAIKRAGSIAELARIFGIFPSAVSQWPRDKPVPELRLYQLREKRPEWFNKSRSKA